MSTARVLRVTQARRGGRWAHVSCGTCPRTHRVSVTDLTDTFRCPDNRYAVRPDHPLEMP